MRCLKKFIQDIKTSYQEHNEAIIDIIAYTQVYFSGTVCILYFIYTFSVILTEYIAWQSWTKENLYGFLICILMAVSWFVFKKCIPSRKRIIFVSDCFLFLLLILLAVARGMGSIYVSYGLAVCTAVSTVLLSLNPLHYFMFVLIAAICECGLNLILTEFDFITALYYEVDAILLFIVAVCLNLFICILRYQVLDETSTLKKESSTDAMTGLYNRKYFEHYFRFHHCEDELSALIHIDLDNFKRLNDTMGHQQGDALLIKVAQTLQENFRHTDCVARVGGDEFMVFMPTLTEARYAVEQVRKLLEQFPIIMQQGSAEVSVSISVGMVFSEEGQSPSYQTLYNLADDAMYQAKQAGKERAVVTSCGSMESVMYEKAIAAMDA